jgi:hypothetical protein
MRVGANPARILTSSRVELTPRVLPWGLVRDRRAAGCAAARRGRATEASAPFQAGIRAPQQSRRRRGRAHSQRHPLARRQLGKSGGQRGARGEQRRPVHVGRDRRVDLGDEAERRVDRARGAPAAD